MDRSKKTTMIEANTPRFDLHNHTYWSFDASAPAEAYFECAEKRGVTCFAITDHHHMLSAGEIASAAAKYPHIRAIRAAELTVVTSLGTVDLLCYGLPAQPEGSLKRLIEENILRQQENGEETSKAMQALGIPYLAEHRRQLLLSYKPWHVVERTGLTHVGARFQRTFFIKQGWAESEEEYGELFSKMTTLRNGPRWPDVEEIVAAVREAGGVIVLAHPEGYFRGADRGRMDTFRKECDLDGIECAHPKVAPELTPVYRAYCQEFGLVSTAGSDSHHIEDIEARFGQFGQEEEWLAEFLSRVEERTGKSSGYWF